MPAEQINPASDGMLQPGRKKQIGMALGLVVALVVAGGFFWWGPQRSTSASEHGAEHGVEATLPLEIFVVNLAGANQRAYLRIGITLGLAHPLPGRNQPDSTPTALVRDTIFSVLSTAQPEELLKPEGKRRLKDELLKSLREQAPQIDVVNVYFTEFLVQM